MNFRRLALLRSVCGGGGVMPRLQRRPMSGTSATLQYDSDPQDLFTDPETQNLLKSMTQMHIDKVFRKTTVPDNSSEYKFMTTEQVEELFRTTVEQGKSKLQMPPVVKVQENTERIISRDPGLKNFSDTKFVITDITYGLKQSDRKVVVRETDGTLQYASPEVSKRMRQVYFPLPGRQIQLPRMFEDEHLNRCLDEHKYEFILDRLTVQFEPYEEDYHRISARVYQHLMESKEFDSLRSTRHFGPMAFFYAWHRCIDDLLYDMIRRDYLRNGVELIALMYKIHNVPGDYASVLSKLNAIQPERDEGLEELRRTLRNSASNDIHEEIKTAIGKTAEDFQVDDECLRFIESYIAEHAPKKVQLELAVQTLKEINLEKKQLYEGLKKAHGVSN